MSLQVPPCLSRLACSIYLLILLLEVTDAETVKVSTTPVFPEIPWEKQGNDFEVLVRVEAPSAPSRRAPIDLVAVLDISSSMKHPAKSGGKSSRLDLLKRAMKFIITNLDGGDRLAIVPFNDQLVQEYGTDLLDMSGDGRRHVTRRVEELTAGGSTAFWPGLEKAVKILDERSDGGNRARFILLLSDGMERSGITWSTEGISKQIEIRAALRKYPVHTFGFSGVHDPNALLFIAQETRGTYSFVNENLARITSAFAICLGGLKTVVAVNTRITLQAPKHGGVQIRSIESGGYASRVSGDRASGELVIDVLYAGEVKNFIVRLHVPAVEISNVAVSRQLLLLTASRYLYIPAAAVSSGVFVEADAAGMSVSVHRPDALAVQQHAPSAVVVNHIVRFKLVELLVRFVQGLEKVATIDRVKAEELANTLQRMWEEFKIVHNIKLWSGVDVWRLEADIEAMVSGLRQGSSVAFIYSWVSSYQMQRATTMGSPDNVAAEFLTLEMKAMLKEAQKKAPVEEEPFFVPLPPPTIVDDMEEPVIRDTYVHGVDLDMIDRRLQLWSKLKRDAPLMFRASEEAGSRNLAAMFHEASLEAINRAMHHDMYLAVVHASSMRRCYSGRAGGQAQTHGHWSSGQREEFTC